MNADRTGLEDAVGRVRDAATTSIETVTISTADLRLILMHVDATLYPNPVSVESEAGGLYPATARPDAARIEALEARIRDLEAGATKRGPSDWCWAEHDPEHVYSDPSEWLEDAYPLDEPTIVEFSWGTSAGTTWALFVNGEDGCRTFLTLAAAQEARAALAVRDDGEGAA